MVLWGLCWRILLRQTREGSWTSFPPLAPFCLHSSGSATSCWHTPLSTSRGLWLSNWLLLFGRDLVCSPLHRHCRDRQPRGAVDVHCPLPLHHEPLRRQLARHRCPAQAILRRLQICIAVGLAGILCHFRPPLPCSISSSSLKAARHNKGIQCVKIDRVAKILWEIPAEPGLRTANLNWDSKGNLVLTHRHSSGSGPPYPNNTCRQ